MRIHDYGKLMSHVTFSIRSPGLRTMQFHFRADVELALKSDNMTKAGHFYRVNVYVQEMLECCPSDHSE